MERPLPSKVDIIEVFCYWLASLERRARRVGAGRSASAATRVGTFGGSPTVLSFLAQQIKRWIFVI